MTNDNQFLDIATSDKELQELRRMVPVSYCPDMKRWKRDQPKPFYLGFIAGINAYIRVTASKMTTKDKQDYVSKLTVDAALIADGFGKIISDEPNEPKAKGDFYKLDAQDLINLIKGCNPSVNEDLGKMNTAELWMLYQTCKNGK